MWGGVSVVAPPGRPSVEAVLEIRRLQLLARAAGVNFTFPLLLYGVAGLVSGGLLAAVPLAGLSIWIYNGWWAVVAVAAPLLVARHYGKRLARHGVGISRGRAGRYAAATELVAVALWFAHPLYPVQISAPWLALAAGAAVVGRVWRDVAVTLVAVAVAAVVVVATVWGWSMPVTDLLVGAVLCAGATLWPRRGPVRSMLPVV